MLLSEEHCAFELVHSEGRAEPVQPLGAWEHWQLHLPEGQRAPLGTLQSNGSAGNRLHNTPLLHTPLHNLFDLSSTYEIQIATFAPLHPDLPLLHP